ncbi:MFS transporter [Sphingopyxis sp. QXT-31]|uniref:MFS transporter n=1 Tax=Sphingopyxis sp. QXT-31 TaxID=1357916 RepID=UPI0009791294|nr:MFS transporter [Sphingopyxis sp. QXT-31]AQA00015.1 MFS transporter [Sphingopyxis sp. QXT-31]
MTNEFSEWRSTAVLVAVCLASASMPLAFTGPTVALPSIGAALDGSPVSISWATNAYLLTFGSLLLAAGTLADRYGRKRVFAIGTGGFGILSLVLAVVPDMTSFNLIRAAEGVTAAAVMSAGMAVLAQEFDGPGRLRAFSFVGTSFGIGLAVAPIASAYLFELFGWRSIFALVVAFDVAAFVIGMIAMKETRDPDATRVDWPGCVSFTLALAALTWAILDGPGRGWSHPVVLTLFGLALALFIAFAVIETRVARPMLDLGLFRYRQFVGVQLLATAPAYGFVVLVILLPIRLVGIDGMSASEAGQTMLAMSAPLLVLPLLAGSLTRWLSPAILSGFGLLIASVGLFWLGQIPIGAGIAAIAPALIVIGVGMSFPWGLMDGLAVSVVPTERAGMAAGIFGTVRVAGEGIALALVTALLTSLAQSQVSELVPQSTSSSAIAQRLAAGDLRGASALAPQVSPSTLLAGYSDAFGTLTLCLAAVTLATAVVVFLSLRTPAARQDQVAQLQSAKSYVSTDRGHISIET